MLKLLKVIVSPKIIKKLIPKGSKIITRSVHDFNFGREKEIITNVLGQILMIGINLPDTKNLLTKTAIENLITCIEDFECNEKISVAILHGCNGNFCIGADSSEETLIMSESLLAKLNELKKPIIGSIDGYATNFGLYLAIMCDMRVMDSASRAGYISKKEDFDCPLYVLERLLLIIGLERTLELICTRKMWQAGDCFKAGFTNKVVDFGCALGQSILLAQSIVFHRPLESVLRDRSKILSFLNAKACK